MTYDRIMSLLKEFKIFAIKGSVIDLAIGVIIGAAFGKVVSSLVADVVMPPLGVLLGGVDFSGFHLILKEATPHHPAISLNYGSFLSAILDFVIVAAAIFFAIKMTNRLHLTNLQGTRECTECLSHIPIKAKRCKYCGAPQ